MTSLIPHRVKKARQQITVKLNVDQLRMLENYGRFINDSRDYIIGQALDVVFKKDKEFVQWLAENSEQGHAFGVEHAPGTAVVDIDHKRPQSVREKEAESATKSATPSSKSSGA